jgi:glutaredoxin
MTDFVFGRLTVRRIDFRTLVEDKAALAKYVRENIAGTFHVSGIMPAVSRGNTNIPTITLAEKMAGMCSERSAIA